MEVRILSAIIITIITAVAIFVMGRHGRKVPTKVAVCIIGLEALGCVLSLMNGGGDVAVRRLKRPEAGNSSKQVEIDAKSGDNEKKITFTVSERRLSDEEAIEAIQKAEKQIRKGYLGENKTSTKVYKNLNLKSQYAGTVTAEWESSPTGIIDSDGEIKNGGVDKESELLLRCLLTCQEESRMIEFPVTVIPVPEDADIGFDYYLTKALAEADADNRGEKYVTLPETLNGKKVTFSEKKEDDGLKLVILMAAGLGLYVFYAVYKQKDMYKKWQKEVSYDYPRMVSQLSMYIGAGFSVKAAFAQVGNAYMVGKNRGHPTRPAFEEVLRMNRKIRDGEDEESAYNGLGDRLMDKGFRKLTLLLVQSMHKGNSDLRDQMEQEERESFDKRRMDARIAGEEASLKLLIPMMGLLGVIFIVLMVPAFMQVG